MTEEEMKEALELAVEQNEKLAQMVLDLCKKLDQASAVIESLLKKLEKRGAQ